MGVSPRSGDYFDCTGCLTGPLKIGKTALMDFGNTGERADVFGIHPQIVPESFHLLLLEFRVYYQGLQPFIDIHY